MPQFSISWSWGPQPIPAEHNFLMKTTDVQDIFVLEPFCGLCDRMWRHMFSVCACHAVWPPRRVELARNCESCQGLESGKSAPHHYPTQDLDTSKVTSAPTPKIQMAELISGKKKEKGGLYNEM